jgi:outer membrane protein TolC
VKSLCIVAACALAGSLASGSVLAQSGASPQANQPSSSVAATQVVGTAAATKMPTVSLRTALDAAWLRAVAARESEGQRRRIEADRTAAASLWAAPPSFELSYRDDRLQSNIGKREAELGVAVPLWLPGQQTARVATADAADAQANAAEQAARWRLAGELMDAAWQIAALQAELAQADQQAELLQQLSQDTERRVRAGDLARVDALAAQAEQLAASAVQSEVRQRLQLARARWTLLTGLTAAPDLTVAPGDGSVQPAAPGTVDLHPELQLARQSSALARQRLDLLRVSRRDAPELSVGLRREMPGRAEASQGSLVLGLRVPFATSERNRPLEVAALAELDVAVTHEQRLHERLESERLSSGQALQAAVAQLLAETTRARLLRERASLFEKSFKAGETPLPDLLRALAAAAQADSAAARQTAALGLARARLQHTLGFLP